MPLDGEYAPSTSEWARIQAETFEATDGAEAGTLQGRPIIVLTHKGARTGRIHKTPLMRVEHGGDYAVIASRGGAPTNPQWHWNLLANPLVELQDGAERHDYRAREVHGEERSVWWSRAVDTWPAYDDYAMKTTRVIPVFVLERVRSA